MSMKKKIATGALLVAFGATAVTGATLAYFTDTDNADNVFTTGNVQIELDETFTQNSKLLPATGSAQDGTLQNGVTKEAWVTNTGTENAYVRVHIAIPQILDDGVDTFDAKNNVLHFNYDKDSVGTNKWDWSTTAGAPYEGAWNYYETAIDGVIYNVYVVTYEKALAPNEKTLNAINQVYLDGRVTNADIEQINKTLGTNWHMYVAAEGTQVEGFTNAYEALNTAFGEPDTYSVDWTAVAAN